MITITIERRHFEELEELARLLSTDMMMSSTAYALGILRIIGSGDKSKLEKYGLAEKRIGYLEEKIAAESFKAVHPINPFEIALFDEMRSLAKLIEGRGSEY